MMMNRRREMLLKKSGGHNLPNEYQEVEYIENTAQAYLNIQIRPDYGQSVILDVMPTNSSNSNNIYGSNNGWAPVITNQALRPCETNKTLTLQETMQTNTIYHIEMNSNYVIVNSTMYNYSSDSDNTLGSELYLFYRRGVYGFCRIYKFEIYDRNGNALRYMIPCYRKEDGEVGMYDKISESFFRHSGSSDLTKGDDV